MTNFEYVFSLLVIILGLGLARVFDGLARAVKRRPKLRIGWGTGLLATWVTAETVIFWQMFWRLRDTIPYVIPALFAGLGITAFYYFAAALVFPDDLARRTTLDEYFMQEKKRVIGAILLAIVLTYVFRATVWPWSFWVALRWYIWASLAIVYIAGPVAMLTRRREVAVACLAVLVLVDLLDPVEILLWPGSANFG